MKKPNNQKTAGEKFPFLTRNSALVVDRLCRDHGLTVEEIIGGAVDQEMFCFEEDLASDGGMSGGELELGFVRDAKRRIVRGGKKWTFTMESLPNYRFARMNFPEVFANRLDDIRKSIGGW